QLNVDITHATINSIGRFMDRPARMKATIVYGAPCNRVLPRVREVRPDPLLTRVGALAIQLIHYVQDVIADLKHLLGRRARQNLPGTLGRTECVNGDRTWSGRIDWLGEVGAAVAAMMTARSDRFIV